ncbi:family 16 glycoside hydrolase [Rhodopirellula sp. JC639]|uniref:family 16 glycoside hydrolase n=1 Tax=Stieleria mannarensis TaxID=2755585 RepID=UPI0016015A43|nr:family 16 glycoside hydrolase [Rhodopirellula sp. JC639]
MPDQRLALLAVDQRNTLESLLMAFDLEWSADALVAYCDRLRSESTSPYREIAISELVKIDLHRSWSVGRTPLLEDYVRQISTLGTTETVSAELIVAEYEARRSAGSNVDLASYESRFPNQFARVRRLVSELVDSRLTPHADHGPSAQPAQASIDTSRIEQVRDTAVGTANRQNVGDLPSEFGRYRIIRELGAGAMGKVYLAHDNQLDRQVALKTPGFACDDDESLVTRFYREARAAAKLHHRNLCPVYDVGEIDGRHFISMAFVKGRSMRQLIRPDKLPPQRTSAILIHRLAIALAEAHRHNVIHRDLKPANIMIDHKKEPVVMDFGLARQTDVESRVTQSGMAVGTPAYMSPEQIRGELDEVGAAADIYALGVILYELLTGQLPFRGPIAKVVYGVVHETPATPSSIRPEIDPQLESICTKMMAKHTSDRYRSMDAVASDVKNYLKGNSKPKPPRNTNPKESATASGAEVASGITETGALNAFFAAQATQDPTNTVVESLPTQTPELVVRPQPRAASRRGRGGRRGKWIATGLGGVLFLAGVIIYFADGSKLKIEDGTAAVIETNPDGTLKRVTTAPNAATPTDAGKRQRPHSPANASAAIQSPPIGGSVTVAADGITIRTGGDARQLAISPDGQRFAVTGVDSPGRFTIHETQTGRQITQFDDPERPGLDTSQLSYSPDGKSLLYCTGNQVHVISATDGAAEANYEFPAPAKLVVFPKRTWALALYRIDSVHRKERSGVPQRLRIWDWKSGEIFYDELAPDQNHNFPAISPDERFVTFGSEHNHVRRTLAIDGKQISLTTPTQFENTSRIRGRLVFSPDGKLAACSLKNGNCMAVILDVFTGRVVTRLDPAAARQHNEGHQYGCSLAFTPNGRRIVMADHSGRAAIWDARSGELVRKLDQFEKSGNHFPPGVAVSRHGHVVLGGTSLDGRITIKHLSANEPIDDGFVSLFPGDDLSGWSGIPGRWTIRDGELIASETSGNSALRYNTALCSDREYQNFDLRVDVRVEGHGDRPANSGIQFRSQLIDANDYVVAGPQADIGDGYWGGVYGEKTSGQMGTADADLIARIVRRDDWNAYRLTVRGDHVAISINGVEVINEDFLGLPKSGLIGFQLHHNRDMTVRFRNARIKEFAKTSSSLDSASDVDETSDWISLFNGSDLTGWKQRLRTGAWSVNSGYIFARASRRGEKVGGWLESERQFKDFVLELEYYLERDGNSGVFLRTGPANKPTGSDQLEIQLLDDHSPKLRGKLHGTQLTGAIYGVVEPRPRASTPINQWNQISIRAVGSEITVHVNGVKVVDADLDAWKQQINGKFQYTRGGPIGLQWYGDRVRFRNIRVRELHQ